MNSNIIPRLLENVKEAKDSLGHIRYNDNEFELVSAGQIALKQVERFLQQIANGDEVTLPPAIMEGRGYISRAAWADYNGEKYDEEE